MVLMHVCCIFVLFKNIDAISGEGGLRGASDTGVVASAAGADARMQRGGVHPWKLVEVGPVCSVYHGVVIRPGASRKKL